MNFVHNGILPQEEKKAQELVLATGSYEVVDGVLYHVQPDKSL